MKKYRVLSKGSLLRPLLGYGRDKILAYAQQHGIQWVEDDSNANEGYDRNFIRHSILPVILQRWPAFAKRAVDTSSWLEEAHALLEAYADEDLACSGLKRERLGESMSLSFLSQKPFVRQKHIIRRWCDRRGYTLPDAAQINRISDVVCARNDASPVLSWGGCELRRYQDRLYLLDTLPSAHHLDLSWSGASPLVLPDGSVLTYTGARPEKLFGVRYRQPGERCKPSSRSASQRLKKLMQDYKLEPWLRDRAPVISCNNEIIAVADLFLCESNFGLQPLSYRFLWEYPPTKPIKT